MAPFRTGDALDERIETRPVDARARTCLIPAAERRPPRGRTLLQLSVFLPYAPGLWGHGHGSKRPASRVFDRRKGSTVALPSAVQGVRPRDLRAACGPGEDQDGVAWRDDLRQGRCRQLPVRGGER